ncbi:MAG: anthranilate phosphoribosyltransferase [Planctomycetota bacterium]|nr:anthranilate phosphoribosyltransferase [Planctomycetota bacterium]
MLEEFLSLSQSNTDLSADQMQQAITWMLAGTVPDEEIRELLLALREKGESVSELVGAVRAMRMMMTPIRTTRTGLLDTCGTGGDGAKTFNISTATAIVAAAAGATVAKHGNRKITSATGSADVLSELGVKIEAPRNVVETCLNELGICFCFAPLLHPAMKHVGAVRRSLTVPTLFNYLGPLCNPAGAAFQMIGVGKEELQTKMAAALLQLPIEAAIVVRGEDGMDEVTLSADTHVLHIQRGMLTQTVWTPQSFGLSKINVDELKVDDPKESAATIHSILSGEIGPRRDIVLANTAASLWVSGITHSLIDGVARAARAIDSGKATEVLKLLGERSHSIV